MSIIITTGAALSPRGVLWFPLRMAGSMVECPPPTSVWHRRSKRTVLGSSPRLFVIISQSNMEVKVLSSLFYLLPQGHLARLLPDTVLGRFRIGFWKVMISNLILVNFKLPIREATNDRALAPLMTTAYFFSSIQRSALPLPYRH